MATDPVVAKAEKTSKSFGANLTDPAGSKLKFRGAVRKDGTVVTFSTHYDVAANGTLKPGVRGATATHPTVEAARKVIDAGIVAAQKQGWIRKTGGGFRVEPDAFTLDTLPAARKAAPAAKK